MEVGSIMNNQNNNELNLNNRFNSMPNNNLNDDENMIMGGVQDNNINQPRQTLGQIIGQPINSQFNEMNNNSALSPNNEYHAPQNDQTPQNNINEMDDSFVEPKKKPFGIIFLILLLLLISGGIAYYYFILDNPKNIFTTAVNNIFDKVNFEETKKNGTIDYNLNLNITSQNEELKGLFDIVNQFKLSGTIGIDNNLNELNGIIKYKDKQLLNYNILVDNGDNPAMYTRLLDLYDKTIKLELEKENITDYDTNINDYKQIASSFKMVLNSSLENANYKKEYLKLNDEMVKKISLNIDELFLTNIYNKLLQDSLFINSYAKINNMTNEEVSDLLNKDISESKDNNETLNIYLSILKNEFIKFEYINAEDNLTIIKDNDKYNFDLSESFTSVYQGFVKITQVNNKNDLTLSLSLIEKELNIEANIEYLVDESKKTNTMDINNSVNLEELTEEETNKIMENLFKNEAFNLFLEDYQKIMPSDDASLIPSDI